jgi:uncharacterized protein YvpB
MLKKRWINGLFIGVVTVLAVLALVGLTNAQKAEERETTTTPTFDMAWSVTQTLQAIIAATETAQPTLTLVPPTPTTPPPTPTAMVLPESFYNFDFVGHRQAYSIGCEASVAVDLAQYYDVDILEYEFQTNLPHSDNPDKGFVGDVNGPWGQIPPYAYGVHAAPVADLLNEFGVDVQGGKGYTLEDIKQALANGHPVIVWVIGNMVYSDPVEYLDTEGQVSIVAPYEHVVVLTGYNEEKIRYNNNGNTFESSYKTFLTSWGVLGNMAVFHK